MSEIYRDISFEEVLPIWTDDLWPDRVSAIEPLSYIGFDGHFDKKLKVSDPIFIAAYELGKIVAVNSIHKTHKNYYRSRGLFVYPKYRNRGVGTRLLIKSIERARNLGAEMVWSMPRTSSVSVYQQAGFQIEPCAPVTMEFGENFLSKFEIKENSGWSGLLASKVQRFFREA